MRICLLGSGSKGNAIYVEAGAAKLLIDCGLSATELLHRLSLIGVAGCDLDAILISHEHHDHTRGAGTLGRRLRIPLVVSCLTRRELQTCLKKTEIIEFEAGKPFTVKDLSIDPFPITHDACDPVGFLVESAEGRVGIATDLGVVTALVQQKLLHCRALVVESNHDEEMLQNGPYPWHLKQRIRSRHGHLSNNDTARLLEEVLHPRLEAVFLAHLSEVNNDPGIARRVTADLLSARNICAPQLEIGDQYRVSGVWQG